MTTTPPGCEGVVVVLVAGVVLTVAGAAAVGGTEEDTVSDSCWTKGSLLPKSPNDSNWPVVRWTTMRSVSGNFQPDDDVVEPGTLDDVAGGVEGVAS